MKSSVFILLFLAIYKISSGSYQPGLVNDTITIQPQDVFACNNEASAIFVVGSSIPNVSFEWQLYNPGILIWESIPADNSDFTGQADDTLTVFNINAYDQFSFRCILHLLFNFNEIVISDAAELKIIQPPVADFSWEYPCEEISVHFKDRSSDPNGAAITTWQWEFGDSDISYLQNPKHIYPGDDDYSVTLTVWNEYSCSNYKTDLISIIPFTIIPILGPNVVFSNQTSNYFERYYHFGEIKENCVYRWILPDFDAYIRDTLSIDNKTLRIDWKTLNESTQVTLYVEEWLQLPGGLECMTGKGSLEILIVKQTAHDLGKIIQKAEDKAILLYLGDSAAIYQWGYTKYANDGDISNDDTVHNAIYHSNYSKFDELNPDYLYWVETVPESWMDCWTRTYYEPVGKYSSGPAENENLPTGSGDRLNEKLLDNPNK
jgi:PKD repeat protein